MEQINQLTDDAAQTQDITLYNGNTMSITITYIPMQYGWFITSLSYGTFTVDSIRITTSPNMLRQFKNQIPFGICCTVAGSREPTQQQDFSSGAANLYILSDTEVEAYEAFLSG